MSTTRTPGRTSSPHSTAGELERLPTRQGLMRAIHFDYSVRLHVFLVVAASIAVGVLVTRLLLLAGVDTLWARWLPALLAAYAAFFIGIWAWLHLSRYGRHLRASRDRSNFDGPGFDLPLPSGGGGSGGGGGGSTPDGMAGGGGTFDGGGASASWSDLEPLKSPPLQWSSPGSGSNSSASLDAIDVGGDEGGCLLVIAGALAFVLLCVVLGGAAYVVYQAPAILAEVVFEVLLASSLLRRTRGAQPRDWSLALLRRTYIPFLGIVAAAMAFAIFARHAAPEAKTAAQVFQVLSAKR